MLETIHGGNPDRFVNQYEAVKLLPHPYFVHSGRPVKGGPEIVNAWGVTMCYPAHTPGAFPVHTPDKIVVRDIRHWRDDVHAPSLEFPQEEWDAFRAMYDAVDRGRAFAAAMVMPGLFEQVHHLNSITAALEYYITEADCVHDLIRYLTDWELRLAEQICDHLHPDAVFHHDDWGSEKNSFLSPAMFEDFFLEPYQEIYGYYHSHGVKLIIHHSDSFAANLVPDMIEMGIDIWQGAMEANHVPELVKQYGGRISFMGDIDNKTVDFPGWTEENCHDAVVRKLDGREPLYFIPCISQGLPGSVFPGVYASLAKEIDGYNSSRYGWSGAALENARLPLEIF